MDKAALRAYARKEFGKTYANDVSHASLVKNLEELSATEEGSTAMAVEVQSAEPAEGGVPEGRKRIIIHKGEGPLGDKDVFVGVNGVGYLIQRNKEVDVPDGVVDVLRNAVETRYETMRDPASGAEIMKPYEQLAYPFSVIG